MLNKLALVMFSKTLTCEILVAHSSISYAQLRSLDFTDDEIDMHRRTYQFLRSIITFEVDRGILHRAHSPTEAWRNLKKWHNPDTVSATQTLYQRFLSYIMRPGQTSLVVLTAVENMAAHLSQQNSPMPTKGALRKTAKRLASPSRESCTNVRAAHWRRTSECQSPRRHTAEQSTTSVEGEGCDSGMNREVSSFR